MKSLCYLSSCLYTSFFFILIYYYISQLSYNVLFIMCSVRVGRMEASEQRTVSTSSKTPNSLTQNELSFVLLLFSHNNTLWDKYQAGDSDDELVAELEDLFNSTTSNTFISLPGGPHSRYWDKLQPMERYQRSGTKILVYLLLYLFILLSFMPFFV